ncbi:MAG: AAA family ATPase [Firmicutes bacterium]|nr:AAA family ATPase [Bacillota bacterium]
MKHKPLPVGVENFEMLVTRGYYFIDKTWFIKELLDKKGAVNLFTRPRRFGKTLNMSMLRYFFEDEREQDGSKKDNSALFGGLAIKDAGEAYLSHMGKYPVISLTLKEARQADFQKSYKLLAYEIAKEYNRHSFVCKGDHLELHEKEKFQRIMEWKGDENDHLSALQFLCHCLKKYYGKKAILLIDEYDVPLENAFFNGFYEEMVDFLRGFFGAALKTNDSLEFAVITGCLRISKESIFTGLNNLKIISILNHQYDEYFGFTNEEVKKLCADYHMPQKFDLIQDWYNGYLFGNSNVYNPWSVIQFVDDLKENPEQSPSSYWANTSSNSIVRSLIERADDETKAEIEALIEGKTVEKPIHEDITYGEMYDSMDNLWNFMFFTGYFRKIRQWMDGEDHQFAELSIPNREVKYIFRRKILTWFDEKIRERDLSGLHTALLNLEAETFEEELSDLLQETISFNDAQESFYHGFMAGALSKMKGYVTRSNRESGRGRSDLILRPVTRRKAAFVLEFKIAKKFSQLEEKAAEALRQIEEKQYEQELNNDGYAVVHKYGIAFFGKDCLVRLGEK